MRSFVHLHCHSHYSLLDGASPIDALVKKAKAEGMNALALTDHGNLYGALEFYQKAKEKGINPILGYEAYVAPGSRTSKHDPSGNQESSYHLTLLAQNKTGFKNLIQMASKAYLEGFYRKPRIDRELLEQYNEGIICLSGCVSGELSRTLLRGGGPDFDFKQIEEIIAWFQRVFGDRYFIEIQNNGLDIQRLALEASVDVARRMGLPLVATSDSHYVNQSDAEAQDIMLCINTGRFRTDTNRMRMEGDQFYLRGPEAMYDAFPGLEDAVARSQEIADRVDIDLELGKRHFPSFKVPEGKSAGDYLRELCVAGLKERYAGDPERIIDGELAPVVIERLDRELNVINTLGFPNYFLIVWDFVNFAKEKRIPATARGSGVGAIVSFALYLSHVCPLKYDLLFERFLDINRLEAPDIDIDFCQERREEVINYVKEKYGSENVAQIGTFGTLKARAAIRDVGRALGLPIPRVDGIVALVPEILNGQLGHMLVKSDEPKYAGQFSADLRKAYDSDGEVKELLDLAMKIEGLARNVGTHAAAVVIADRPLVEYVPLQHVQDKKEVITQWAMGDVEKAGLLKMDFLGLRNLTILAKSVDLIEQSRGVRIDPYKFPLDDQETFALLCRGETKGIFQLESGGIRDLLQRMKPDHFRDIIATNALYRPGPLEGGMVDDYIQVKHGRKAAEYKHPVMKDVLEETHGVMVYQEQVMRILNGLGGIELSSAYSCIKAISKKKEKDIAKFEGQFLDGSVANGLKRAEAAELFGMIQKFAGYGFNKSHSTAYALIAYMTAYLKAHYPVEFMAALLCGDIDGRNFKRKDSLVEHLEDCRRMNIEVMAPDVNTCDFEFTVLDNKIYFGLSAIKGCGGGAARAIAAERRANGPFRDLTDFCGRLDASLVNKTAIESLVKAGAFDRLGGHRAQWLAAVERALQAGAAALADKKRGQKGLFDDADDELAAGAATSSALPNVAPWEEKQKLLFEREVLGFYLSSHPLSEHEETLRTYCTHTTVEAAALSNRAECMLGGMIGSIKISHTKNPQPGKPSKYAMFDLEDAAGLMRTIVWPEQYAQFGELVQAEAVVALRGVIDKRPGSEDANFIVNEVIPLDQLPQRFTRGIRLRVDENVHSAATLERLLEILRGYPGRCELQFLFQLTDGSRLQCVSDKVKVELHPEMRERLVDLLGPGSVQLLAEPPKPTQQQQRYGQRNGQDFRRNGRAPAPA
ncbi:MAG: DNA polymerase III subunit alpha [Planctomycetes bacterium]|nr:DNA polymerase III subunit alpha [Planctomycetota bacterium]